MNDKFLRRSDEEIAKDRAADAEMGVLEAIYEMCESEGFLCRSDKEIAADIELHFGIPSKDVIAEFNAEDSADFRSWELIWRAWNKRNV